MKRVLSFLFFCSFSALSFGQSAAHFADSLRVAYRLPELAYAVVSAEKVIDIQVSGVTKINTDHNASLKDRFRIGSNTKTVTAMIAAQLVKQGKIKWDAKLMDLCPELKKSSRKEYMQTTLIQLLSFRSNMLSWTYTNPTPLQSQFSGNDQQQRHQFVQWALQQPPIKKEKAFGFSNPGYIAAGVMLERAAGKTYEQLAVELGNKLDIAFEFGSPNNKDTMQPWGHDANLNPEEPADNYKLNWLLPAGNINVTLPDYAQFAQEQLKGLYGESTILTRQEYEYLHFGLPGFAVGWFWEEEKGHKISYNVGNPGTFLSELYVDKDKNRAYVMLTNVLNDDANKAFDLLLARLKEQ